MKARYTYALDPDVEELLQRLAKANNRSKGNMIETLINKEFQSAIPYIQDGLNTARDILTKKDESPQ